MTSSEIRKAFLDFFAGHGHAVVKSSPLIPEGDPTLLFTSAGMVQFKPYYLGLKTDLKRAASCQKSFRTTDIDNVGRTIRHLTFFEMLGNFSFGDYFKSESIKWGWDFLVRELGLPAERFYPSVYSGGVAPKDDEARAIWESVLPPVLRSHIIELGDADNFWAMGDTGPCGPCSEIYWDRGEKYAHDGCKGPGCSCDRYIEVWNHVFTQFDKQPGGVFAPLPRKNIDTGMGLERLAFIVEEKETPFGTTLFQPVITRVRHMASADVHPSRRHGSPEPDGETESALRVIADHSRACVFLAAEGIIPSNEGRGYVLRRLIRRASRYGRLLGLKKPFLHELLPEVAGIFKDAYPEIGHNGQQIQNVLLAEEEGFLKTLETGEQFLAGVIEKYPRGIPGEEAFKLYETYGFPLELTRELALKKNIPLDEEGFNRARRSAQETAKAGWKDSGERNAFIFQKGEEKFPATVFAGYEALEAEAEITGLLDSAGNIAAALNPGAEGWAALDRTPFYAESGGQVGDVGLFLAGGAPAAEVLDTQKPVKKVFFHHVKAVEKLRTGDKIRAAVSTELRRRTACNHTAVHVVNAALRKVLGPALRQAGSIVTPEKFRFDYTAAGAPSREELAAVERAAASAIAEDYGVFKMERPLADAEKFGALTLLGEKYADPARFVLINSGGWDRASERFSLELCGGTHIDRTGGLIAIKILKDSSVARGVRRIEGAAGPAALDYFKKTAAAAEAAAARLSAGPDELLARVEQMIENEKKLRAAMESLKKKSLHAAGAVAAETCEVSHGVRLAVFNAQDADMSGLRSLSDRLKAENSNTILFIHAAREGKFSFVAAPSADFTHEKFSASQFAKDVAQALKGSGGGRKDFAQGGGPVPKDFEAFKKQLAEIAKKHL